MTGFRVSRPFSLGHRSRLRQRFFRERNSPPHCISTIHCALCPFKYIPSIFGLHVLSDANNVEGQSSHRNALVKESKRLQLTLCSPLPEHLIRTRYTAWRKRPPNKTQKQCKWMSHSADRTFESTTLTRNFISSDFQSTTKTELIKNWTNTRRINSMNNLELLSISKRRQSIDKQIMINTIYIMMIVDIVCPHLSHSRPSIPCTPIRSVSIRNRAVCASDGKLSLTIGSINIPITLCRNVKPKQINHWCWATGVFNAPL